MLKPKENSNSATVSSFLPDELFPYPLWYFSINIWSSIFIPLKVIPGSLPKSSVAWSIWCHLSLSHLFHHKIGFWLTWVNFCPLKEGSVKLSSKKNVSCSNSSDFSPRWEKTLAALHLPTVLKLLPFGGSPMNVASTLWFSSHLSSSDSSPFLGEDLAVRLRLHLSRLWPWPGTHIYKGKLCFWSLQAVNRRAGDFLRHFIPSSISCVTSVCV